MNITEALVTKSLFVVHMFLLALMTKVDIPFDLFYVNNMMLYN